MSMATLAEPFTISNPNPISFNNTTRFCSPPAFLHFKSLSNATSCKLSFSRPLLRRTISSFATASPQESNPSEVEDPKEKRDINVEANESEEAWKQTLALFKEKALMMQSVSQEAYEEYSKKAAIVFKETSEQLKIQAEKAKQDLSVISENTPVKDVVDTFVTSTDDLDDISEVRDFYLGIPYGLLLTLGGFLSFMITGSIPAIRFGIILGGALLALSVSSFQAWKRGESSSKALKGQAAIATILFLRDLRIVFSRSSLASFLTVFISGAMLAFYVYRIKLDGNHTGGTNLEPEKQN